MSRPAPAADALPVRRFTTDGITPARRHEAWAAQDWPSVARMVDSIAEPGFEAHSEHVALGPIALIGGRYGAQTVRRTPERLRREPMDHLLVCLLTEGRLDASWGTLRAGEIVLIDLDAESAHRSGAGSMINFMAPRALALAHGIDPRRLHGTIIPAAAAALLCGHLRQLQRTAAGLPATTGATLGGSLMDLLTVALAAAGRAAPPPRPAVALTMKALAEQLLTDAMGDPGLDAAALARALGISRATLYRLFQADGGVQRRLRDLRLAAAARALGAPDTRVGDVAARFGFTDAGHFSRAFRAAYGRSPSDYQADG